MAVQFQKSSALQSLSMTPLIDVVFLLLIFFLVATRFAEEDRAIDLRLPSVSQARPLVSSPDDIDLFINSNGEYFVGRRGPYELADIEQMLGDIAGNGGGGSRSVKIRADLQCDWDHVVRVYDACNRFGFDDVKATASIDQN